MKLLKKELVDRVRLAVMARARAQQAGGEVAPEVEGGLAPPLLDVEREALEKQFERLWGGEYAHDSDEDEYGDGDDDEDDDNEDGDEVEEDDEVGGLDLEDAAVQAALEEYLAK
ncbi:hypothetical protein EON65_49325, partial [archaeon]